MHRHRFYSRTVSAAADARLVNEKVEIASRLMVAGDGISRAGLVESCRDEQKKPDSARSRHLSSAAFSLWNSSLRMLELSVVGSCVVKPNYERSLVADVALGFSIGDSQANYFTFRGPE